MERKLAGGIAKAFGLAACAGLLVPVCNVPAGKVLAQETQTRPAAANHSLDPLRPLPGSAGTDLVNSPVVDLRIGGTGGHLFANNPVANDPASPVRGMQYFNQFNCVGCHAANGAGGMGPSLSNSTFIYGDSPENIYLSILQGRPNGMPSWGALLPGNVIWDLVSYVQSISQDKGQGGWGVTSSLKDFTIEQVPAEYLETTDPWKHTQQFKFGQAPDAKPLMDTSPAPAAAATEGNQNAQ